MFQTWHRDIKLREYHTNVSYTSFCLKPNNMRKLRKLCVYIESIFIAKIGKIRYTSSYLHTHHLCFSSRNKPIVSDRSATNGINFYNNDTHISVYIYVIVICSSYFIACFNYLVEITSEKWASIINYFSLSWLYAYLS